MTTFTASEGTGALSILHSGSNHTQWHFPPLNTIIKAGTPTPRSLLASFAASGCRVACCTRLHIAIDTAHITPHSTDDELTWAPFGFAVPFAVAWQRFAMRVDDRDINRGPAWCAHERPVGSLSSQCKKLRQVPNWDHCDPPVGHPGHPDHPGGPAPTGSAGTQPWSHWESSRQP